MEIEQRTEEWFTARLGKVTASRVNDVMAKTKTGYSASRDSYMTQLVLERITQTKAEGFTSQAMQWGVDQEIFALAAYQAHCGWDTDAVGFVPHPTIEMAGASPDAVVTARLDDIGKRANVNSEAAVFARQSRQLRRGVERGDSVTASLKCLGITPRSTTCIENQAARRNHREKAVMQRCHF